MSSSHCCNLTSLFICKDSIIFFSCKFVVLASVLDVLQAIQLALTVLCVLSATFYLPHSYPNFFLMFHRSCQKTFLILEKTFCLSEILFCFCFPKNDILLFPHPSHDSVCKDLKSCPQLSMYIIYKNVLTIYFFRIAD